MFPRVIQAGSGIFSGRALACVVGEGQPVPALHRRKRQAVVKMANAKGLSLRGGQRPTWRPEREARGSALGVQSRSTRLHRGKVTGEIATAFPRLPRRFAPRNDTSGRYCGAPAPSSGLIPLCKALNERRYRRNWLVRFCRKPVRIGGIAPGAACRSPTTHDRRSSYYSLFILQYSLFHPSPCGGWQTI